MQKKEWCKPLSIVASKGIACISSVFTIVWRYGSKKQSQTRMLNHSPANSELPHSPYHHQKGTEMTAAPSNQEPQKAKYEVALNGDTKITMLLNVEGGVKEVIAALAKKEAIKGAEEINLSSFAHYPNSITGVCMHLMLSGLKAELDIGFDEMPKSIRQRGNAAMDRKINGKKRLLTREEKNELLEQTQMSYYEAKISAGAITIEDAMNSIREAFTKKKGFEDIGYILPVGKVKYPYWQDGEN